MIEPRHFNLNDNNTIHASLPLLSLGEDTKRLCWETLHGKQKKFYAHAMIYPWRCIATRGRVCLCTHVDRKRKRFTMRLM